MTSTTPHEAPTGPGRDGSPGPTARRHASMRAAAGPDPVHPAPVADKSGTDPDAHRSACDVMKHYDTPPPAADLGVPAVLDHRVVAVEVGRGATPVSIHAWAGDHVCTVGIVPKEVQVWARAGRLTLCSADGRFHRLTVLCPQECGRVPLGAHWPFGEPENRLRRIASAAAHDLGEALLFPAWVVHTAHISGERNRVVKDLVRAVHQVSPQTRLMFGQTTGLARGGTGEIRPYRERGLLGREGYPHEL